MASDSAESLAQSYLDKHKTPDLLVGLGPVLGDGISLYAGASAMIDGSLHLTFDETKYVDCRVIAERMYSDILAHNPELKPRIVMQDGRLQNWVEITDPQDGRTIQIDATPWYGSLNPGLVGKESNSLHSIDGSELQKDRGPILSVKRTDVGVITISLAGYLPKVAAKEKLAQIRKLQSYAITDDKPQPEYSFVLSAIYRRGFIPADPEFGINVYIDVMDSAKLQRCIQNAHCIEDLVKAGAVEIGTMFSMEMKLPMPMETISLMSNSSEKREVTEEITRNLPGIMELLRQATPVLPVYGKGGRVEVKYGIMHNSNEYRDLRLPSGFNKNPSVFSGLIIPEAGMRSDYANYLRNLKFKSPIIIHKESLDAPLKGRQTG